nr:hypothetical protein [Tanacetum cinerariifolium]
MAALVISISSNVSVESVGSSFLRFILIGSIYVEVLVAPEVGPAAVALPVGVLELDTHSSSEADPLESLPPPVSVAPMVLPFLCSDDSKPCRVLTARKSVRPLPSHHLALRTLRCSEAYLRWRSTPLSTMYPPTTSKLSIGDSSSESSTGPSHKRCRSHAANEISHVHSARALVPSPNNLLPPRKRFRNSISSEDSVEKDIDTDVLEDIKASATTIEVAVDRDGEARIDGGINMEVDVGINVEDEVEDEVESINRGTMEAGVDMDAGIDIPDGMLMSDIVECLEQLIAIGEKASLFYRTRSLEQENLKVQALLCIERDRVNSLHRHMALSQEEFRQIRRDRDDTRRRLRRYVGGLHDIIQRNVMSAELTRLQDAIRLANSLMDQKLKGYAVKNAKNKRRLEVSQRDTRGGQNVVRAYTTATMRDDHIMDRYVHATSVTMQGHYKSDCPKLKDQNRRNKVGNKNDVGEARGKAYVLSEGDANPDSNFVNDTFLLNNHYASMIIDLGTDKSFMSTTFSTLLYITLDSLDVSYDVELADERISETNIVLRGCTL